jgi:hypothetical protein
MRRIVRSGGSCPSNVEYRHSGAGSVFTYSINRLGRRPYLLKGYLQSELQGIALGGVVFIYCGVYVYF